MWPNNSCGAAVEPQKATQSFSASHVVAGPALECRLIREEKDIALALVISLQMKMGDEIGQCSAERIFTEQDQFSQAFLFLQIVSSVRRRRSNSDFARALESI